MDSYGKEGPDGAKECCTTILEMERVVGKPNVGLNADWSSVTFDMGKTTDGTSVFLHDAEDGTFYVDRWLIDPTDPGCNVYVSLICDGLSLKNAVAVGRAFACF